MKFVKRFSPVTISPTTVSGRTRSASLDMSMIGKQTSSPLTIIDDIVDDGSIKNVGLKRSATVSEMFKTDNGGEKFTNAPKKLKKTKSIKIKIKKKARAESM